MDFWLVEGIGALTVQGMGTPRWVTQWEAVREARETGHPIYAWFPERWELMSYLTTIEREANLSDEARLEPVDPGDTDPTMTVSAPTDVDF